MCQTCSPNRYSNPVFRPVRWWRNESGACQRTVQRVWQRVTDCRGGDCSGEPDTSMMVVSVARMDFFDYTIKRKKMSVHEWLGIQQPDCCHRWGYSSLTAVTGWHTAVWLPSPLGYSSLIAVTAEFSTLAKMCTCITVLTVCVDKWWFFGGVNELHLTLWWRIMYF